MDKNENNLWDDGWDRVTKLQARYLAGDHDAAMVAASEVQRLPATLQPFVEEPEYHFYAALARAARCDSIPANELLQQLEALTVHHDQLRVCADLCPENFAGHTALVGAEIARIEGRADDAAMLYEQAIRSAQESGFAHVEALVSELASRFYAARGLGSIARMYMQKARDGYLRWGANAKVRQLEEQYPYLRTDEAAPGSTNAMSAAIEPPELATVIKALQAVSSEIRLEMLIEMIMRTAIEQAGAERGLLILSDGRTHRLAAEATTAGDAVRLQLSDAPVNATMLPESILYHVLRTGETTILDDASAEPMSNTDPYVGEHRARSILCLPLRNGAKLMGALYLENNRIARGFSPGRIAVLKIMASQAAVSLENARLYRDVAESEAKMRRLVDANIIGFNVWDADGNILEANDVFLRMVGYGRDDLVAGRVRCLDLTAPEKHDDAIRARIELAETGRTKPFEMEYVRKDGGRVPVIVGFAASDANGRKGVAFVLDLTEQKQAEKKVRESEERYREVQAELAHANRVATMGQLAASIAHELSQPIASTVISAEAALRWLDREPADVDEASRALDSIVGGANRAADVLGRIRQLVTKAPRRKEPVAINEVIREIADLVQGEARKSGAQLEMQLAEGLPFVEGDRVELQQVLLNLIINALEALNDIDRVRRVCISTTETEGACVLVTVRDSGPGFGPNGTEHAFTAFYTTKATGLGMGLSICRSIIDAHGGRLWATDSSPRGAVVQFTVPQRPAVSSREAQSTDATDAD